MTGVRMIVMTMIDTRRVDSQIAPASLSALILLITGSMSGVFRAVRRSKILRPIGSSLTHEWVRVDQGFSGTVSSSRARCSKAVRSAGAEFCATFRNSAR